MEVKFIDHYFDNKSIISLKVNLKKINALKNIDISNEMQFKVSSDITKHEIKVIITVSY